MPDHETSSPRDPAGGETAPGNGPEEAEPHDPVGFTDLAPPGPQPSDDAEGETYGPPEGPDWLHFENPMPSYTLPLLGVVLSMIQLPLAGLLFLLGSTAQALLLIVPSVCLFFLGRWYSRHGIYRAVHLDPIGAVVEFGSGMRALRWDEVVSARDSRLRDGTLLRGVPGDLLLPWRPDHAVKMLAYAADRLWEQGVFHGCDFFGDSGVLVDPERLTLVTDAKPNSVAWRDIRDIRLELLHSATNPGLDRFSIIRLQTAFHVLVDAGDTVLRIRGVESNLALCPGLVAAWKAWGEPRESD
ncbi:MAG: hypothetical protein AB7E32_04560 [Desulfovibrio sp.]